MSESAVPARLPDSADVDGVIQSVRFELYSEADLRRRWGGKPGYRVVKIPGAWKHGEIPDCLGPVEFGSFFVSFDKA